MSASYAKTVALDIINQMAGVTLTGVTTPPSAGSYAPNGTTFGGQPVYYNADTGLFLSAGIIGLGTNWLITDLGPLGGIPNHQWTGPAIASGPAGAYSPNGGAAGTATVASLWSISYAAQFERMYVTDLEAMAPAGDPASQMTVTFAPVSGEFERTGWGGVRTTVSLGLLFNVMVQVADGVVTDPNIDAYEQFIDQVCTWLVGARKFATTWSLGDPKPIFGDHYNDHLYQKGELHVPVLLEAFQDIGGV